MWNGWIKEAGNAHGCGQVRDLTQQEGSQSQTLIEFLKSQELRQQTAENANQISTTPQAEMLIKQTLKITEASFRRQCFVTGHCCSVSSYAASPSCLPAWEECGDTGGLPVSRQHWGHPFYRPAKVPRAQHWCPWLAGLLRSKDRSGRGDPHLSGWRSPALSICRWRFRLAWHEPLVSEILRTQMKQFDKPRTLNLPGWVSVLRDSLWWHILQKEGYFL